DFIVGSSHDRVGDENRVAFRAIDLATLDTLFTSEASPVWIKTDKNADLKTDVTDLSIILDQFNEEGDPESPFNPDSDGDQIVTATDLCAVLTQLGTAHPLHELMQSGSQGAAMLAGQVWRDGGGDCLSRAVQGLGGGVARLLNIDDDGGLFPGCGLIG